MLHDESFAALDVATLYALLRLRVDVFVVEQACPYPDLDGLDTHSDTRHVWEDEGDGGSPVAYLRLVRTADGTIRIGRVATAAVARHRGLAERLVVHALSTWGAGDVVLDAQAHLVAWYRRHGFEPTGPAYDLDGIAHVPMRRRAAASSDSTSSSEVWRKSS